ncbi:MAG: LysR family transcriptional regulator [Clostridia bacterium]|nr:LysR family transcriptional regulator [Clostridia bacterium]
MELLQLKYFCDAAETENFSETAKKFYVPTSAISQSIKRLEGELSVQLFARSANRIRLNDSGKLFYERVKEALALLDGAKKQIADDGESGKIKLSIFINRRLVMQTVEKFNRLYPDVDIVTKYTAPPEDEDFDLIVTDAVLRGGYVGEQLLQEEILLALRDDHPLASKEQLSAEDIGGEPFICTNQGSSLYHIAQEICADMGFSPHIVIRSDDPYYIRKCIELGLGVSLIPAVSWRGQFSDRIVLKKIHGYRRKTVLYRNAGKYIPKCVERFAQMLRAECAKEQELSEAP